MPIDVSEVIGIDLGTTFSVVGIWKGEGVEIIFSKEGYRTVPSCVSYTSNEILVGNAAKDKMEQNWENTVYDVKRLIGKAYDPTMAEKMGWLFTVKEGSNSCPAIHVKYQNQPHTVSPEEVSAIILKKMKETVERNIGKSISKAVISVPAYFLNFQKQATINAAKIAELEVIQLITEPAAAAYAYGFDNKEYNNQNILVFDFGGGTFDVLVIEINNGIFTEKSPHGDTQLGGRDIDTILVNHFIEILKKEYGCDELNERKRQKLLKQCVKLKKELSGAHEAELYLGDILPCIPTGKEEYISISRDIFNKLCHEIFEKVISITKNCLNDAKMKSSDIHKVLLIGGSSRIPKLEEELGNIFGKDKLDMSIHPDEAVAYGAAIRAAQLCAKTASATPKIELIEATPLSLGVALINERFTVVIPRNESYPCCKTKTFCTTKNNQECIKFAIYQGERPMIENNSKLGEIKLNNLSPGLAGSVKCDVTFELNENGILKVTATHKNEKAECNIIQNKPSQKSIEDSLKEAKMFKEQDDKVAKAMIAKTHLEQSIEKVKYKLLTEKTMANQQKTELQEAVNEAEKWLTNTSSMEKEVYEKKKKDFETFTKLI
uniref:Heat shock protein 70 n=1 Tax=Panagrolaimus sp. PS1159 TaxID=55785 RepID=A0AC35G5Q9_9BILA